MKFIKERVTDKTVFRLSEENILFTGCAPNTIMSLEDGMESTRISAEMVDHVPLPLLCDLTNVIKMSAECRKHFAGDEHAKTFSKAALIVTSPISKIIGNFFLGLNKPKKPTKLFTNKDEGLAWLRENEN